MSGKTLKVRIKCKNIRDTWEVAPVIGSCGWSIYTYPIYMRKSWNQTNWIEQMLLKKQCKVVLLYKWDILPNACLWSPYTHENFHTRIKLTQQQSFKPQSWTIATLYWNLFPCELRSWNFVAIHISPVHHP